jgi:hypothetical protein
MVSTFAKSVIGVREAHERGCLTSRDEVCHTPQPTTDDP